MNHIRIGPTYQRESVVRFAAYSQVDNPKRQPATHEATFEDMSGSFTLLIKLRNFPGKALSRSLRTDHSCERKKLLCERHCIGAVDHKLALSELRVSARCRQVWSPQRGLV